MLGVHSILICYFDIKFIPIEEWAMPFWKGSERKIPPLFEYWGSIFLILKSFWNLSSKYGQSPFYSLIMNEVSRNFVEYFFYQITPTFENKSWIFFWIKSFLSFLENTVNYLFLN